jgi:GTP-binding protein Era
MNDVISKCGFVAIVGRPNVGKSTLMNRILGQKISITSRKRQTTRHKILGIKSEQNLQVIYVDTPGMHLGGKTAMNRYMNRTANTVLSDVDLVLFVVDISKWTKEDENVLRRLKRERVPVMLVINKVDQLKQKERLLPMIAELSNKMEFTEVIPVSAKKGNNLDTLQNLIKNYLPESGPLFPEEQITDKSERFIASEIIREKLMRRLQQELPYALTTEIERFSTEKDILHISAVIWVERDTQKKIVIGKNGEVLKEIGKSARIDMEKMFERKVNLQLWVKVKEGWSDNEGLMKRMGYDDIG